MSTLAKVFVVLNLLLAVAFLASAGAFLGHSDNWKARHDLLQVKTTDDISKLNAQNSNLQGKVKSLEESVASANATAEKAQRAEALINEAYTNMKVGYDQANVSYQNASRALLIAQETIKNGRLLVDELQAERTKLIDQIRSASDKELAATTAKNNAENALELSDKQLQDANEKLTNTSLELQRTTFRLNAILARNPGIDASSEQPAQQAKILQADNQSNIVIISLGSEDGVKAGFKYTVSRGSSFVAEIQITNVQTKSAAGRVVTGLSASPIRIGDDVMTSR